ncbi:hypothetical protein PanWU01x14_014430 [Parasponia andersonii]|uniref:Uncharacterized protein n=1 Tax=Parasponia andersonii TaxID=3476 RepID=A0A2P5E073_PARAD|nr:hypothetical protein PanWU01x14_014430 [Parasponia andersonii]
MTHHLRMGPPINLSPKNWTLDITLGLLRFSHRLTSPRVTAVSPKFHPIRSGVAYFRMEKHVEARVKGRQNPFTRTQTA